MGPLTGRYGLTPKPGWKIEVDAGEIVISGTEVTQSRTDQGERNASPAIICSPFL